MLFLLVACMAPQLGGEETDGYVGGEPALEADAAGGVADSSGGTADSAAVDSGYAPAGEGPSNGTASARAVTADDATSEPLSAFGLVGGVAVVDRTVRAIACEALPWQLGDMRVDANGAVGTVTVTYGLPDAPAEAPTCVLSYVLSGIEARDWTLVVGDRSVAFTTL